VNAAINEVSTASGFFGRMIFVAAISLHVDKKFHRIERFI